MNAVSMLVHAGSGVQLHPFYSLAGAVLGTALMCILLLSAFTHPLPPNVASGIVELHLTTLPTMAVRRMARTVPREGRPLRPSAAVRPRMPKPVVIPESGPVKPISPSASLDLGLPGSVFAPPAVSAFVPQAFNPYSDLSRALNAPLPASTMQDGDAYRSVYGLPVVKSGGRCLALQTVQTGPSPQAHTTVGFGVPCPGAYRPSMADELKAWVTARASHKPGPPG